MKISVLTIFPEFFDSFLKMPIIKRAINKEKVEIEIIDIKNYANGSFRKIDDSPYGGGVGMVMRCQPILDAIADVTQNTAHTVLLSPKGRKYDQQTAREFADYNHLIIVCGHYEGVDARVEKYIDDEISIGDYILSGGETGAIVLIDSIVRLLDGVLREGSPDDESYENGLLEYPQYTRPAVYNGDKVPDVLLSGNQKKIDEWRHMMSLLTTKERRPDLFEKYDLSEEEKNLLKTYLGFL